MCTFRESLAGAGAAGESSLPHAGLPPDMRRSRGAFWSPWKYAAILAGTYVLVGTLYIVFSTRIAAALSLSVEQMRSFETGKGVAYVGITAILLYCLAYGLRIRIRRQA